MLWLTFLAAALILLYVYVVKPLKFWKERNVPCLEPAAPVFGNYLQVFLQKENVAELVQKVYAFAPKARFTGFYKFTTPVLLIKDPNLIPKISGDGFESLPVHNQLIESESPKLRDEAWKTLRAALSLPSINTKMRSLFLLMEDHAQHLVHVLEKTRNTQTVDVKEFFRKYTSDVMTTCICGGNKPQEKHHATTFSPSLFLIKLFGLKSLDHPTHPTPSIIKRTIIDVIKGRDKEVKSELLELLLEGRKCRNLADDAGSDVEIPEDQVLTQALLSFVSGSHTATTLMCFVAHELATNPYIQRKLTNEVEKTLRECDGILTYEALMGMTYLDMVVSETLRKWPPKPGVERKSLNCYYAIQASNHDEKFVSFPKRTSLFVPIHALHRDPELYHNPELFDPERFSADNKYNRNPYVHIPFGAGPRSCVGSHFALLECKTVVFSLLSSFEIVPVEKTQVPLRLSKRHFDVCPEDGMRLGLKPRKSKVYY